METTSQSSEGLEQQSNGNSVATPVVLPSGPRKLKGSPEQREKWRREYRQKVARLRGEPIPATVSSPVEPAGYVIKEAPAPSGVPWSADLLRSTTGRIIDAVEKSSIDDLREEAAKISDKALAAKIVAKVNQDAPWNSVSKETLKENLPQLVAEALNAMGISSERAPLVLSVVAVVEIWNGHTSLRDQIRQIAAEHSAPKPELKEAA